MPIVSIGVMLVQVSKSGLLGHGGMPCHQTNGRTMISKGMQEDFDDEYGDCRQEIVFIGVKMDEAAIKIKVDGAFQQRLKNLKHFARDTKRVIGVNYTRKIWSEGTKLGRF